jgi:hypothetical protein
VGTRSPQKSSLLGVVLNSITALAGITPERAATNFVALATDPALKGVSGYYFSKPANLEKRKKLAFGPDELEALRRVLDKYSELRGGLLTAGGRQGAWACGAA